MEDGSCGPCEGRAPAGIPQEEILRGADLWSGRLEDMKFLLALFLSICLSRCLYRSLSPSLFVCLCLPICLSLFLSLPLYLYLSFLPKSVSSELGEARGLAHSALALSATGLGRCLSACFRSCTSSFLGLVASESASFSSFSSFPFPPHLGGERPTDKRGSGLLLRKSTGREVSQTWGANPNRGRRREPL